MKYALLVSSILVFPEFVFAMACSSSGTTVVYVNGIETTQQQATYDTTQLRKVLQANDGISNTQFLTGYNPTHLDGLGDDIESISQAFNAPISDYDLDTILTQIASEVTTRKLLLVGHSQGTFYTNELYSSLVKSGASPNSIAVYNIGTPASFVAGGGTYLTSANDKVINTVRELDMQWGAPKALAANITIPQESGYTENEWGGHIPSVYFGGAPKRIVSDIKTALAKLSADSSTPGACFQAPTPGFSYDTQRTIFAVADPLVGNVEYAAADAKNTIASVIDNANDILHTAFSDAIFSVIPKPTVQNAAGVFAVEKALYGSSLSVADYEALVNGEDISEVRPTPESGGENSQKQPGASIQVTTTATESPSKEDTTTIIATSTIAASTSTIPIHSPLAPTTAVSPGFGGGAPAPSVSAPPEAVASSNSADANTLSEQISVSSSSVASTTSATVASTSVTDAPADESATTSSATTTVPEQEATSTPPANVIASAPLIDHFDTDDLATWIGTADGAFQFDSSSADCYANDCIENATFGNMDRMYKIGTPLSSGSAVLYFKNDGYLAQITFGICNDSGCADNESAGIYTTPSPIFSNDWHYWFLAWREGVSNEEICELTDDSSTSDCSWEDSGLPSGTFDGIVINQNAGMSRGGAIYFDELGSTLYTQ